MRIRTRFAPSPTGSLHIGGARTALFNFLFAKKHGGDFILRIEDTDVARSTEASYSGILADLTWFRLGWNEGPEKPGKFGPYRQSDRRAIYQSELEKLIEKKLVYRCFCTPAELDARRKAMLASGQTPGYDGRCRKLSTEEQHRFETENRLYSWRFAIPEKKETIVHDLVRGDVRFETELIGDFVLMKSNGFPSYNFACVIDDHQMQISHVIRGDEHLTNTPRQILLYEAFGWELPEFAHISMILAPDHTKLSKRHGTTAVTEFKANGFLPPAILNYIALLGWSPKDDREIFLPEKEYKTIDDASDVLLANLADAFSLDAVSKNPAVFDTPKLNWMNSQYIKRLSPETLKPFVLEILPDENPEKISKILETQRQNFSTLTEIADYIKIFYQQSKSVAIEPEAAEVLAWPGADLILRTLKDELAQMADLLPEEISPLMKRIQQKTEKKGKELYWPIRAAVTGKTHGPEFVHLFPILGKEEILRRLGRNRA